MKLLTLVAFLIVAAVAIPEPPKPETTTAASVWIQPVAKGGRVFLPVGLQYTAPADGEVWCGERLQLRYPVIAIAGRTTCYFRGGRS